MMNKPILLMGALLASTSVELSAQKNRENPNIVFVLADDMGIGDLGCYGQKKIKTPNIDQLAEKGLLFTNHYSGSTVSAPSRCCLLTGKHTGHAYIRGNKGIKSEEGFFDLHLPEEEVTVAEVLKEKGYDAGQLERLDWKAYKETQYNKLAEIIRESLDMEYIYQILGKGTRMP